MLPLRHAGQRPQQCRSMSIRGTPIDPEAVAAATHLKLPALHAGVVNKPPRHKLPIIVCFGDSHTQGQLGSNWVDLLQSKFRGQFRIVNCGVNGHVLESIRQRVKPTLEQYGPDVVGVIIMGGTNDALANINPSSRKLIRCYNPFLKDLPPLEEYPTILEELVAVVYRHCSPFLQIVVMTPPILGEDPDAPENEAIKKICGAIREMVHKFTRGAGRQGSGSSSGGGRERRVSSSASTLREDGRIESVNEEGTPLAKAAGVEAADQAEAEAEAERPRPRSSATSHDPHHHRSRHRSHSRDREHHQHQHRRLHFIDWNRAFRRHLDEHYEDRPRKRMEPRFLDMCFATSVAVVGGTLAQSYDKVSNVRGFAMLNDGVHMNERAVAMLVGLLERWVEDVQEELVRMPHLLLAQEMSRLRLTTDAAPAHPQRFQPPQRRQIEAAQQPSEAVVAAANALVLTKTESRSRRTVSGAGSIDGEDRDGDEHVHAAAQEAI